MSKRVWITALAKDEAKIASLMGSLKKYGLVTDGHFWVDDIKNMAWAGGCRGTAETGYGPVDHCGGCRRAQKTLHCIWPVAPCHEGLCSER
jgi:hypothetical protein